MLLAFLHTEYLIPGLLLLFLLGVLILIAIVWWVIKFLEDRKKK